MLITVIFILFHLIAYESEVIISPQVRFEAQRIIFYIEVKDLPFSEQNLLRSLYFEQIDHPEIVLRQAKLETGNFTSEFFIDFNNVFGMKYPVRRETTAIGMYKHHAVYIHWTDAVRDYRLWQDWYKTHGYDLDNYLVFLQEIGYASDKNYIKKIS